MYRNTTIYFYRFRLFYYLIYIIIPLYDIIDSIKNNDMVISILVYMWRIYVLKTHILNINIPQITGTMASTGWVSGLKTKAITVTNIHVKNSIKDLISRAFKHLNTMHNAWEFWGVETRKSEEIMFQKLTVIVRKYRYYLFSMKSKFSILVPR